MIMTVSTISSELLILCYQIGLIVHSHKPVCLMMKLDCCLSDFRLFTQGSGSRKQNILSSDYTHSWWIIHFGCALFNMCDPIPIFGALVVSQWGHESGLSRRLFLQLKIGQLSRGLHPRRTLVLD